MERNKSRKGGRMARVPRAPPDLMVPAQPWDSLTLPLAQDPISAPGTIIPCPCDDPAMPAYNLSVPKFHFFAFPQHPSHSPRFSYHASSCPSIPILSPLGPFVAPSFFCLPSLIPKSILPQLSPAFSLSPGSCWFPQSLLKLGGQAAPLS